MRQKTEKETDDFTYNIQSYYEKLITSDRIAEDYKKNMVSLENQIADFLKTYVVAGRNISLEEFDFLLSLLDDLSNNQDYYYSTLFESINYRYVLQQEIGILFDAIESQSRR